MCVCVCVCVCVRVVCVAVSMFPVFVSVEKAAAARILKLEKRYWFFVCLFAVSKKPLTEASQTYNTKELLLPVSGQIRSIAKHSTAKLY